MMLNIKRGDQASSFDRHFVFPAIAIHVKEYAQSEELNGSEWAYFLNKENLDFGLDGWQLIESIQPLSDNKFEVVFSTGDFRFLDGEDFIFLPEKFVAKLASHIFNN